MGLGAMDEATADRLLGGTMAPEDVPQGYQDVVSLLQAAAAVASEAPASTADAAVSAFHAARPQRRIQRMKKWQLAAATLAGGLTLSTGLAAADVLPDTAQDVASSALSQIGINVPDGDNGKGKGHTKVKTADSDDVKDDGAEETTETSKPENHGSIVSNVARDDSTSGAEHGTAVCTAASEGKCQTGGKPSTTGGGGPSANSTEGSANAGQSSGNSTEGETNAGQGPANAGQSSGNSTSGSTSTQTGGSSTGDSGSSTNVSSGAGG